MKKVIQLFLAFLAILFVACVPLEQPTTNGDITKEEIKQIPKEQTFDSPTGKAIQWDNCFDEDSYGSEEWWQTAGYPRGQLFRKTTTTYASGKKEDSCFTFNKGKAKEKTRLVEGICTKQGEKSKFTYWYADCSDMGKEFACNSGACVPACLPFTEQEKNTVKVRTEAYYDLLFQFSSTESMAQYWAKNITDTFFVTPFFELEDNQGLFLKPVDLAEWQQAFASYILQPNKPAWSDVFTVTTITTPYELLVSGAPEELSYYSKNYQAHSFYTIVRDLKKQGYSSCDIIVSMVAPKVDEYEGAAIFWAKKDGMWRIVALNK